VVRVVATCSSCRAFTGETTTFDVEGETVRQVIAALDRRYPGFGDHIRKRMAFAIDGEICRDALFRPLKPTSEVYIIPKIAGG
jgi:molybdopterin converting factor small subunit